MNTFFPPQKISITNCFRTNIVFALYTFDFKAQNLTIGLCNVYNSCNYLTNCLPTSLWPWKTQIKNCMVLKFYYNFAEIFI